MLPNVLKDKAERTFSDISFDIADGKKTLLIMRGLPGSGKSSVSNEIQRLFQTLENTQVVRISTDEILEMCEAGYKWAGYKMKLYHSMARKLVNASLNCDVPLIILDNTNIKRKEFESYIVDARAKGYKVRLLTVGYFDEEAIQLSFERNSHNVPIEAIRRMAQAYQPHEFSEE